MRLHPTEPKMLFRICCKRSVSSNGHSLKSESFFSAFILLLDTWLNRRYMAVRPAALISYPSDSLDDPADIRASISPRKENGLQGRAERHHHIYFLNALEYILAERAFFRVSNSLRDLF